MAKRKAYGKSPTHKVFIRVQEMVNGRPIRTKSFSVYGRGHGDVVKVVEAALEEQYGDGLPVGTDAEDEGPSIPNPTGKHLLRNIRPRRIIQRVQ